jgi:hypothetical protein
LTTRAAALAALMMLAGATAACSPSGQSTAASGAGQDQQTAGLDQEILKWRKDIIATDPLCKSQADGEKCEAFEVSCKALRNPAPDDAAKGVTVRVVANITWNGFDPKFKHAQSGTRAAEFAKNATGWSRTDHKPVNPESCADL